MMRISFAILTLALLALPAPGEAADDAAGSSRSETSKASQPASDAKAVGAAPPTYVLPNVGKPRRRVAGGRRGTADSWPAVYVLVPDHVGLTVSQQPTLYWYFSEAARGDVVFEVTLIDEESIEPMVEKRLATAKPGLQRVRLADYGVTLQPDHEYQWSVALVSDRDRRSRDVVSTGWIERIAEPDDLAAQLTDAGADGAIGVYGQAGLWYDLLATAVDLARGHPDDARYQRQLTALLAQVGLPESAAEVN